MIIIIICSITITIVIKTNNSSGDKCLAARRPCPSYLPYSTPLWNRSGAVFGCVCRLRREIFHFTELAERVEHTIYVAYTNVCCDYLCLAVIGVCQSSSDLVIGYPEGSSVGCFGSGDDAVGNPHRTQISQFELFELVLLLKLDERFPVEQFEATVSQ